MQPKEQRTESRAQPSCPAVITNYSRLQAAPALLRLYCVVSLPGEKDTGEEITMLLETGQVSIRRDGLEAVLSRQSHTNFLG